MSTVREICEGVSRSLLDSPVSDIHLSDIASRITEWQELAPYLDLSEADEKDIVDSYPNRPKLQPREALQKWKESNGDKATYRRLIAVLCSQGRVNLGRELKELLTRQESHTGYLQYAHPVYSIDFSNSVYTRYIFENNEHVFIVEQSTRFFLKFHLTANPMSTSCDLYKHGQLLHQSPWGTVNTGGDYVHIQTVDLSHAGTYTISSRESRLTFKLRVVATAAYREGHMTAIGQLLREADDDRYCVLVFYTVKPLGVEIDIAVIQNDETNITEVKREFSQRGARYLIEQMMGILKDSLSLDIPLEGSTANDWRIVPLTPWPATLLKRVVDSYKPGMRIPHFHLLATRKPETSSELDYIARLIGATEPSIHITVVIPQAELIPPPEGISIAEIDEISKKLFQEAMLNEGHVLLRSKTLLLIGVAGVGKTCFSYLLFDESPPLVRESTPLAQSSIRAISFLRATITGQGGELVWERISSQRFNFLIADVIKGLHDLSPEISHINTAASAQIESAIHQSSTVSAGPAELHTNTDSSSLDVDQSIEQLFAMEPIQELLALISNSKGSDEISRQDWVYVIDSGGQPQFHDLLPTFVRHVSAVAFFVKLNEALNDQPTIVYYSKGGIPHGDPYVSSYNHLQIIQNCLQAMQSRSESDASSHCPELFFVGTHRDLQSNESLELKNKVLQELLLQHDEYRRHFYRHSPGNLLYAVNSKEPNEDDKKVVDDFRTAVMNIAVHEAKIPIRWFVLEQLLQKLSNDGVISFKECLQVASHLGMKEIHLQAALNYLVKLNIFEFYPDILPDVVFTSSQILLNKITELVEFSHYLHNNSSVNCHSIDIHFRDYGELSLKMLQRDNFSRHYVPGLFDAKHLLNLLVELLVVAKGVNNSFTMPAVLSELPLENVAEKHVNYVTNFKLVPIAIHYPGCLFPSGVFCSLLSLLQNHHEWMISQRNGMPECLFKNCIKFDVCSQELLADVTLVYKHTWIEVYPEIQFVDNELVQQQACLIRDILLNGLMHAAKVQKYKDLVPKLAYFCSCKQGDVAQQSHQGDEAQQRQHQGQDIHIASVFSALGRPFMRCTHNIKSQLKECHHLWLKNLKDQYLYSPSSKSIISPQTPGLKPTEGQYHSHRSGPGIPQEARDNSKIEVVSELPTLQNNTVKLETSTEVLTESRSVDETLSQAVSASGNSSVDVSSSTSQIFNEKVSLRKLNLLKYTDSEGIKHCLDIIEKASHKWGKISDVIFSDAGRSSALQQRFREPSQCLRQTLIDGFIENTPPEPYSQNWNGLIELIDDVGLGTLAKEVKYALAHEQS